MADFRKWRNNIKETGRDTLLKPGLYIENLKSATRRVEPNVGCLYPDWWGYDEDEKEFPPEKNKSAGLSEKILHMQPAGVRTDTTRLVKVYKQEYPKKMVDEMTQTDFAVPIFKEITNIPVKEPKPAQILRSTESPGHGFVDFEISLERNPKKTKPKQKPRPSSRSDVEEFKRSGRISVSRRSFQNSSSNNSKIAKSSKQSDSKSRSLLLGDLSLEPEIAAQNTTKNTHRMNEDVTINKSRSRIETPSIDGLYNQYSSVISKNSSTFNQQQNGVYDLAERFLKGSVWKCLDHAELDQKMIDAAIDTRKVLKEAKD